MSSLNPNPLTLLPARGRQTVYITYGLIVIVVGAVQVGYSSVEGLAQPTWLTIALAVTAYLGLPVSALAATNVASQPEPSSWRITKSPEDI